MADPIPADFWDGHRDNIVSIARKYYPALIEAAYTASQEDYDLQGIAFDLANPAIQDVIEELATRIVDVSNTTRDDVRRIIDEMTANGSTFRDAAEQIRGIVDIRSQARATVIARTESAVAYNKGAILSYRDAGIERVEVLDGDGDEECAAANGQHWDLDYANEHPIQHPNCVRALAPVVGG